MTTYGILSFTEEPLESYTWLKVGRLAFRPTIDSPSYIFPM